MVSGDDKVEPLSSGVKGRKEKAFTSGLLAQWWRHSACYTACWHTSIG